MRRRPIASLVVSALTLMLLAACSARGDDDGTELPPTSVVVAVDRPYKYDAEGSLPIEDLSELPIAPGAVTARWYMFRGWYVVVFEGLDLEATGPVCPGISIFNPTTYQVERVSYSPTAEGACDDAGAGPVPPARGAARVRTCDGLVSYVTQIPADLEGVLYADLVVFSGDGTAVGLTSRVESTIGPLGEIDASKLDCGPLPRARAMRPPTPVPAPTAILTPVPASSGAVAAAGRAPPPTPTEPSQCAPAEMDGLQDVTETATAPYFVHHPAPDNPSASTVIFLPGGSGRQGSAQRVWDNVFADAPGAQALRVVIPYTIDADFIGEANRTFAILNEVLWCYGGDPAKVHLAGTSNGGLAAFALMVARPEHFATLLGAPGAFPVQDPTVVDPAVWAEALAGRAVFNGVGALDGDWKSEVIATHNALAAAGIESVFVEFAGQGHALRAALDESVFFDFWARH